MNAMEKRGVSLLTLIALLAAGAAHAAGADLGQSAKQATNWTAIIMFGIFVVATLWITKWAASKTRSAADFAGLKVVALAGIGHPPRFFATLTALGLVPVACHAFPDHHRYTVADLPAEADAIVVTEKDAVKLRGLDNGKLWVLPVAATLMPDLADWLTSTLKKSVYGQQTA